MQPFTFWNTAKPKAEQNQCGSFSAPPRTGADEQGTERNPEKHPLPAPSAPSEWRPDQWLGYGRE